MNKQTTPPTQIDGPREWQEYFDTKYCEEEQILLDEARRMGWTGKMD